VAVVLPRIARDAIAAHAEASFPEEACGLIFGSGAALKVVPMENIQNRLHQEDPGAHPRDATRAYYFDPRAMLGVLEEHDRAGIPLRAIYHSHPDHDAYFSQMDSAAAAPFGEPSYAGAVYLVLSVRDRKTVDLKAFDWSAAEARYVEVPVTLA
jgi:proteasome lid subunit RPN8/RPN11